MSSSGFSASNDSTDRVHNLGLPPFIKCAACLKNRQLPAFSKKQLTDYKLRLTKNRSHATLPRCRTCVGGQVTELTCINCGVTRGLNAFAKAQRSNPDHARCVDCVQEHLDTEPVLDDAIVEEQNEMHSYDTSSFSTQSIRQSLSGITSSGKSIASDSGIDDTKTDVSDTGSRIGISSEFQDEDDENEDDEADDTSHGAWKATASTKKTGTEWDRIILASSGYRVPRVSTSNSVTTGGNPGFVKLKAVAPSAEERQAKETANEQRYRELEANRTRFEDDDENDDDGWEL